MEFNIKLEGFDLCYLVQFFYFSLFTDSASFFYIAQP